MPDTLARGAGIEPAGSRHVLKKSQEFLLSFNKDQLPVLAAHMKRGPARARKTHKAPFGVKWRA
jgi:hypothetical protein